MFAKKKKHKEQDTVWTDAINDNVITTKDVSDFCEQEELTGVLRWRVLISGGDLTLDNKIDVTVESANSMSRVCNIDLVKVGMSGDMM